ncbi:MAG TPA: hypothetical protein VKV24_20495 [Casimicrobiaceae bacterium]|nr:hypothetical protein [Casimicrobiaceae bacterium]
METYIVRIYRRASNPADGPVGTVECVGSGERHAFVGRAELFDRLFPAGVRARDRQPLDGGTETQR